MFHVKNYAIMRKEFIFILNAIVLCGLSIVFAGCERKQEVSDGGPDDEAHVWLQLTECSTLFQKAKYIVLTA